MRDERIVRRSIATGLALLVVLGNLATFRPSEAGFAEQHHALRRSPSVWLLPLTMDNGLTVRARFLLEVWLREEAPGAQVTVAAPTALDIGALEGLGRATVEIRAYPDRINQATAAVLEPSAAVAGPRRSTRKPEPGKGPEDYGSFAIVVPEGWDARQPLRFLTYRRADDVFLVEESMAERFELAVPR